MSLLTFLLVLIVAGVLLWLVNTFISMNGKIQIQATLSDELNSTDINKLTNGIYINEMSNSLEKNKKKLIKQ